VRILVLGINYVPEKTSVAPFTTGLCEHLAALGHRVTVITAFPYYPEWRVWDGYRGELYRREWIRGVEVRRVRHFVPSRASRLLQRLAHDFSFTLTAFLAGLFSGSCDMIYCSCPPPTVAFSAYLLSKIRGKPYVIKLTDLASEAALATGILENGLALRLARVIEDFVYRRASKVVCLCQGFIEKLASRGLSREKLQLIPDWADLNNVYPLAGAISFRNRNGIAKEDFLILHTGNMGKKQGLLNVVRAAELSQKEESVQWTLVGDGEERAALEQQIHRCAARNIRMLPLQPAGALAEMYSTADLLLLNQKAAVQEAVIPSKLLTYMAAGRPILAAASEKSEAAKLIRRGECGLVVPPEKPEALVESALFLQRSPALRQRFGRNGRAFVAQNFTSQKVLHEYGLLFSEVTGEKLPEFQVPRKAAAAG
jgi:colanic acid biosynthesis glycosyl transferase WcaI